MCFVYCRGDEMSEYIVDDRGQHELWEEIQKMSDEEKKKYIQNFERKRREEKQQLQALARNLPWR